MTAYDGDMATIVVHKPSEKNYVLINVGFGVWATDKPGFMGFADKDSGEVNRAFVCGGDGVIRHFPAGELAVVSVDGSSIDDLLSR